MRIGIATDHCGFPLKEQLVVRLNLNVICLGGRIEGPELAWDLVQTFLAAKFTQADRHLRRLRKVAALETQNDSQKQ